MNRFIIKKISFFICSTQWYQTKDFHQWTSYWNEIFWTVNGIHWTHHLHPVFLLFERVRPKEQSLSFRVAFLMSLHWIHCENIVTNKPFSAGTVRNHSSPLFADEDDVQHFNNVFLVCCKNNNTFFTEVKIKKNNIDFDHLLNAISHLDGKRINSFIWESGLRCNLELTEVRI